MKILLVDDSSIARKPAETHLEHEGYEVSVADDGRQALELFGKENFDLVVTDIWMPNMDGFELLRSIKEISPDTDIIIITGFADVESSIKALRLGASNYLLKPLNLEELSFSVENIHRRQVMAKKLKEQDVRLNQISKMADLGLVAAGVAHEINNPNAFIRGNAQTLQKFWGVLEPFLQKAVKGGIEPPDNLDFVIREMPPLIKAILEGTHRIKKVVDATASFTRYNEDFHFKAVDINDCIREGANALAGLERSLILELRENLPPVEGVRQDLVESFTELFRNCQDATKNVDQPRIRVTSYQPDKDFISVQVQDNGVGIKPEHEHRVFTPFFSSNPKVGRPGLGLTKVFALVRGFGGDISFSSREGEGTTFTIKLPVHGREIQPNGIIDS